MDTRTAYAEINLDALHHNVNVVKKFSPHSKIMAVVKSMAYGHGAIEIASSLKENVDMLAVARIGEGVNLRKAGIQTPIVILEGPSCMQDLEIASEMNLQPTFHDSSQILWINNYKNKPIDCWIKFDSGMNRLGFEVKKAEEIYRQFQSKHSINEIRLMTHLSCADDINDELTNQQIKLFHSMVKNIEADTSIANSAGILAWPESHVDWVRPGLMLYGASPIIGKSAKDFDLKPVMTLRAPLISIKKINKDARVGYGGTWIAPEEMLIGIVSIGYGDGYPRHINDEGRVLVNDTATSIIGRVSMDMIAIDLRGVEAQVGDFTTLWGEKIPIDQVAKSANTIPYTLLCNVTTRIKRKYKSSP